MKQDQEQQDTVKAAIVAWCINKLGGEVRIPREALTELINGAGCIYMTGDPTTDEYIIRTEKLVRGKDEEDSRAEFNDKYNNPIVNRLLDGQLDKLV